MIDAVSIDLQQLHGSVKALGCLRQHSQQVIHADGAGARTREQNATRSQYLHAKRVQATIGLEGLRSRSLAFGKCRGNEYDDIKQLPLLLRLLQVIEHIDYKKFMLVGV